MFTTTVWIPVFRTILPTTLESGPRASVLPMWNGLMKQDVLRLHRTTNVEWSNDAGCPAATTCELRGQDALFVGDFLMQVAKDVVPIERRPPQSSSSNSDFCFRNNPINLESPAADELFLNGKIVPIEIKNIVSPSEHALEQPLSPPPQPFLDATTIISKDSRRDQGSKEKKNIPPLGAFLDADDDIDEDISEGSNHGMIKTAKIEPADGHEKPNLIPSSRFKRSSSSRCASMYGGRACPFPLLFCRSNSDVSEPNVKRMPLSKRLSGS
ncbi:unnamed protein product [Dovyalis caffra]|uniref:Uncharacterized protein n=1 Tax=Dovyalis caffra TaxID=77055 RepID=A0AAV1S2F3_9ROSI|nr:unnamed protein product [Dovyalis caffra]